MWVDEPETRGAAVDLLNAILTYALAGALVLWLIAEDRERSSRVLGFVSDAILAQNPDVYVTDVE